MQGQALTEASEQNLAALRRSMVQTGGFALYLLLADGPARAELRARLEALSGAEGVLPSGYAFYFFELTGSSAEEYEVKREEAELTVHPGSIALLHAYLVQATRRSQVIVTTHSPELLDLVQPDDVRVVCRSDEGVTSVAPMAASQRHVVRQGLMTLGEVMRTEGFLQEPLLPAAE